MSRPLLGVLGARLLGALLLTSLAPLFLLVTLDYLHSRDVVRSLIMDNVAKSSQLYASELDTFIEEQRLLVEQSQDAERLVRESPHIEEVYVQGEPTIDPEMALLCARMSGQRRVQPYASDAHLHQVLITTHSPQGERCARISFTLHQDLLTERAESLLGGHAYIVNDQGEVVCHAFKEDEPHHLGERLTPAVSKVVSGSAPWTGVYSEASETHYGSFSPVDALPWGIWVEVPDAVVRSKITPLLQQSVALALTLALALTTGVVLLVRRLLSPLRELALATSTIAEGRYGETLPVSGRDEIATLAREFNRMSHAVAEATALQDEKVALRTQELKEARDQMVHQEKMAALGTLSAGLAHEIGNPLASMSSELEYLEASWDPEEARRSLPVLRDQVRRMSGLLRELSEVGRSSSDQARAVDATRLIETLAHLLGHDPRAKRVQISTQLLTEHPVFHTSPDRVLQVLLNLGLNALDAMQGQGVLEIRVLDGQGDTLHFEVRDSGPGLTEELAARIFEPFFSTKETGKGTGLGLFVSERIVDGLGGRIQVTQASQQRGATFTVVLPRESPNA